VCSTFIKNLNLRGVRSRYTLTMVLEHDASHIEVSGYRYRPITDTNLGSRRFLYILIRKADSSCSETLLSPGIHTQVWSELVKQWNTIPAPVHPSVELGPEVISVGRDNYESDVHIVDETVDVKSLNFGWDNEKSCRQVEVGRFRVDFPPITIEEFTGFGWMV